MASPYPEVDWAGPVKNLVAGAGARTRADRKRQREVEGLPGAVEQPGVERAPHDA